MQAVMITMQGREDDALETADNLAEADISTEIFVQPSDWPIGGEGNNRNSRRALDWAIRNAKGPGVLFAEDDIRVLPKRVNRALAAATEVNELVYMYMHDIAPRTDFYPDEPLIRAMAKESQYHPSRVEEWRKDKVMNEGLRRMKRFSKMFGSQCVYIPKPYLRFLHAHMNQSLAYSDKIKSMPNMAMDTSLNNWHLSNDLPVYSYLPHPVQHLQNRKLRTPQRRGVYSQSFDIISDLEVADEQLRDR